jgi:multidrug efflux pump subunit AcrB
VPRFFAEVDREKAKAMNVSIPQVFDAMRSTFGSLYVNDFTLRRPALAGEPAIGS